MRITVYIMAAFLFLCGAPVLAQESELFHDIIRKLAEESGQGLHQGSGCPQGYECATVDTFVKKGYDSETRRYQVGHLTSGEGYRRIVVLQHIGEKHGIIINTIKVRQGGRWVPYTQGMRLPEGRTELPVPVPADTPEIIFSFDHGRGAEVGVVLERPVP